MVAGGETTGIRYAHHPRHPGGVRDQGWHDPVAPLGLNQCIDSLVRALRSFLTSHPVTIFSCLRHWEDEAGIGFLLGFIQPVNCG